MSRQENWLDKTKFSDLPEENSDIVYMHIPIPWYIADDTWDYLKQRKNVEKLTNVISLISAQPILHCNTNLISCFRNRLLIHSVRCSSGTCLPFRQEKPPSCCWICDYWFLLRNSGIPHTHHILVFNIWVQQNYAVTIISVWSACIWMYILLSTWHQQQSRRRKWSWGKNSCRKRQINCD